MTTIVPNPAQKIRHILPDEKRPMNHPLADAFPKISSKFRWKLFLEDVGERGRILEPVTLIKANGVALLLDGRHRLRAARELDLPCPAVVLPEGEDPAEFVLRKNASASRNLTALQRATAAIQVWEWRQNGDEPGKLKEAELAKLAGVSMGTAHTALVEHRGRVNAQVPKPENALDGDFSMVEKSPSSEKSKPTETPEKQTAREQASATRTEGTHATTNGGEPEELSRLELLQLDLDIERQKVKELRRDLDDAERKNQMIEDASNPELAIRLREVNNLLAENRSLTQQVAEWQTKAGDAQREATMWRKRAMKLGWSK